MLTESMLKRASALKLFYGVLSHEDEINEDGCAWLERFITWEECYRLNRSLEGRIRKAKLGRFKQLTEFDWEWPKSCDRALVEQWMLLDFMDGANNLIVCGPNGVGKTMIVTNIAQQAVLKGSTALFITAAAMLNELADLDSDSALRRRIKYYTQPALLIIDEIGYLSYSNRHADLLFEVISQRYENKSTCITTNKVFTEWHEIFPNAACVVSIVDRLVHHSEILNIEGESYRLKEAKEKNTARNAKRNKKKKSSANDIGDKHEN
jgi:DNA replication protein DnaC